MTAAHGLDPKLSALRAAFDESFAHAPDVEQGAQRDFLAIRIAGNSYALCLAEVMSLHADRTLARVPSPLPELLGIAGFRGALTPIYDLGALLGYPAEPLARWLVIARWLSPIGLGFQSLGAHLRVTADSISTAQPGANAGVCGAVKSDAGTLPLLHLPSLIEGLVKRIKALGPARER
jgi:chemotaxis signal transduction protein